MVEARVLDIRFGLFAARPSADYGTVVALVAVILVSLWLGAVAQRAVERGSFIRGYFLGNRGLGAWALALTATVQSGGTFMGFPSYVYSYGWVVALWISSYMVVPITGFAILGKRFAQLSRRTGALTVPDLLAARFDSEKVRLVSSLLIMVFMSFLMFAQFKAGALIMKLAWPSDWVGSLSDRTLYLAGLGIFTATVVSYTLIGGFLASVWTDLFQSVLMAIGVVLLFFLVVPLGDTQSMRQVTIDAAHHRGNEFAFGPGPLRNANEPASPENGPWLPIGLAISFFIVWSFGGVGAPAGLVRLMACKDTATMRRSVVLLSVYNWLIYIPLILICISGRALLPDVEASDEIVPRLAIASTNGIFGGSLLSGLILAAPFGAVMATVSTYLVVISSGLVRDFYQRVFRPDATSDQLRRASYLAMIALGAMGMAATFDPPTHLQSLIEFSALTTAATFVVPAVMAAYCRRATAAGALAAMLVGASTVLLLFGVNPVCRVCGITPLSPGAAFHLFDLSPVVWGLTASLLAGIVTSALTRPPSDQHVSSLFDVQPTATHP